MGAPERHGAIEVFGVTLGLGLTSFGGPIAHLGYFERAYVRERRWLSADEYAGLVALCQMLPGPASSQVGLLVGLRRAGWARALAAPHSLLDLAGIFYKAGALVFGGGHVVLPLLRDALVPGGWLSDDAFLAGYGATQAMPGPLFTFSAYLGAIVAPPGSAALWSAVALTFMFLPGILVALAGLPLWTWLARHPAAKAGLAGVNAAVVGVLGAALYDPIWTSAIHGGRDVAIALVGFLLLERWRIPPLAVVGFCVAAALVSALVP